jgi:hypothetical protein
MSPTVVPLDPALHAQHAGDGKPADVGVEHADRQPPLRQHDGEVGGDRRLADPALPEAMATIRAVVGMSVFSAFSRAFHRAWAMRLLFCSTVISPKWTRTSATSGRLATRSFTSFIIWARSGQPTGRGQGDGDVHVAALAVDVDAVDHAQVDHVVAQLGVDHPPQGVADGLIGEKDESGRARFAPLEKPIGPGRLKIVSMGSIEGAGEDQAIMWRGFMLNRAVQHFLEDVRWGDLHCRRGGGR